MSEHIRHFSGCYTLHFYTKKIKKCKQCFNTRTSHLDKLSLIRVRVRVTYLTVNDELVGPTFVNIGKIFHHLLTSMSIQTCMTFVKKILLFLSKPHQWSKWWKNTPKFNIILA